MATDLHRGLVYRGGALNLGVLLTWGLRTSGRTRQRSTTSTGPRRFGPCPWPARRAAARTSRTGGTGWRTRRRRLVGAARPRRPLGRDATPALVTGGWYDLYSQRHLHELCRPPSKGQGDARRSRLVVGPWPHDLSHSTMTGGVDFGARSMLDLDALEDRWLDRWLRDRPQRRRRGGGRSHLRHGRQPVARRRRLAAPGHGPQPWYLHSAGARTRSWATARSPPTSRRRIGRHVRLRPGLPGPDQWRLQLLPARHHPVGSLRPARRRDAHRRPRLHERAARARRSR